jgi:hypothetical protein
MSLDCRMFLAGGGEDTQERNIKRAKAMWNELQAGSI